MQGCESNNKKEVLARFRLSGLRLTKTRKMLVDIFSDFKKPLSVPELSAEMKRRGLSLNKTTVYRELEQLSVLGLVESARLADRRLSYELAGQHHHHFVCVECEAVTDVHIDENVLSQEEQRLSAVRSISILRHCLEFFGLCEQCQSK